MILLTSTSDLIQVVTGSAVTGMDVHASYVDVSGTTVTPGRTNTPQITGATTTTIVASPGAITQRNVKFISIRNAHASSSNTITVQHSDGTTTTTLVKWTLKAGYTMTFNDLDGWVQIDASGGRVATPLTGRYLGTSVLTSASANFTTGPETNTICIRGVAGGGGGGGVTAVSSQSGAAGGGGAGSYAEKTFAVTPNTAYAYTCGALGSGSSGALGGTGGNSTFVVGATTVTCNGGVGGPVATVSASLTANAGGAGGAVATNGDVNAGGDPGANGLILVVAGPVGASGAGGSSPFGSGGVGKSSTSAAGNAATGHGAGGGGAIGITTARAGGDGTAGMWIVDEYS